MPCYCRAVKRIPLTKGQFAIVDDEDYERINAHKWHSNWDVSSRAFRAVRSTSRTTGRRKTVMMHREIMNAPAGACVDHINHNPLDNRKVNLRLCSKGQNNFNQRLRRDNKSGFKGVYFDKSAGKWGTEFQSKGEQCYIGLFTSALDAALAYDARITEAFGEFAMTNKKLGLL